MRLEIANFRGLRQVDWRFDGVCALTGPNGAGKTSVLTALAFLRDAYVKGLARAVDMHGGVRGFRNVHAGADEPTTFRLTVANMQWQLAPVLHGEGISGPAGESLQVNENLRFFERQPAQRAVHVLQSDAVIERDPASAIGLPRSPFLSEFIRMHPERPEVGFPEKDHDPNWWLPEFAQFLERFRFYAGYNLAGLRRHGSQSSSDNVLAEDGGNVFSVLRNWRDKRATRERFEFVVDGLRAAFPHFFDDMDFEVAGSTTTATIYSHGSKSGVPIELASNGFLVGLLHLSAVASLSRHAMIAIDEPENGLHPFAIGEILEFIKDFANARDATVVLATHSPAFLNLFNREPGRVFVMEPGLQTVPIALDKHRNPAWLAHFSLGNLYLNQDYGAPDLGS